jgi:hypothetical protein
MFITQEELAIKLYKKSSIWLKGKPKVEVDGDNRSFGRVKFVFPDKVIAFRCYLFDKSKLLKMSQNVVANFDVLLQPYFNRDS